MKKILTIGLVLVFSMTVIFSYVLAKDSKDAWLGVSTQTVDEELSEAFDLEINYGAIVNDIIDDSPADKAGLLDGDVIILFNNDKVYDYDDLIDYLEDSSPDESVKLTIMRDNDKMTLDVTLDEAPRNLRHRKYYNNNSWHVPSVPSVPSMPSMPSMPDLPDFEMLHNFSDGHGTNYSFTYDNSSYIGVHLTDLSDQLREHFGVKNDAGVLVSEVEEDSPAEKAGIKAGDIIIEADNNGISDYRDLKESIADKDEGETVSITLVRDKREKQIDVTVAEHEDKDNLYFNAPDISIRVPHGKRHTAFFSDDLNEFFDSDEFNEEMKELKKELEHLKFELKNEMFEEFDSKEFKREMKKFKKEMQDEESQMNKELKSELKKLKIELKELEKRIDD